MAKTTQENAFPIPFKIKLREGKKMLEIGKDISWFKVFFRDRGLIYWLVKADAEFPSLELYKRFRKAGSRCYGLSLIEMERLIKKRDLIALRQYLDETL